MNLDLYDIGVHLAQGSGIRTGVEQAFAGSTLDGVIDKINGQLGFSPKAGADIAGMTASWEFATNSAVQMATAPAGIHTLEEGRAGDLGNGAGGDMQGRLLPTLALPALALPAWSEDSTGRSPAMAGMRKGDAEEASSLDVILSGGLSGDGNQPSSASLAQDFSVPQVADPTPPKRAFSLAEMPDAIDAIFRLQPQPENLSSSFQADAGENAGDGFFQVTADATAPLAAPFPQTAYEGWKKDDAAATSHTPILVSPTLPRDNAKGSSPVSLLQAPFDPLRESSLSPGFLHEPQPFSPKERSGQAWAHGLDENNSHLVTPSRPFTAFLPPSGPDNASAIANALSDTEKQSDVLPTAQPAAPAAISATALAAANNEIFSQLSGNGTDTPGATPGFAEVSRGNDPLATASPPAWLVALTGAVVSELLNTGLGQNAGHPAAGQGITGSRTSGGSSPSGTQRDPLHVRLVGQQAAPNFHMPAGPAMPLPSQSRPIPGQVQFPP